MGNGSSGLAPKAAMKQMLAAAKKGDAESLAGQLPREPLLLLCTNYQGYNVFHYAAQEGHLGLMQLLISHVQAAASEISAELAHRLEQEQQPEQSVVARWKRLHSPVLPWGCSRKQMLQLLDPAQVLPTLLSWQSHKGITPLMLAARHGHACCLAMLLDEGASPLLLDKICRRSCLHYAAIAGQLACVNVLVSEFRTVDVALPGGSTRRVLLQAATLRDGFQGNARFIDLRTSTGFSPLHYAAFWGYGGIVRVLMAAGADALLTTATSSTTEGFELVASGGSCALHLAAANGHRHVAAAILQAYSEQMAQVQLPAPLLQRASAGGRLGAGQQPWEGLPRLDPRLARNSQNLTPMALASVQRNSGDLVQLLDPTVPVARTLQSAGLQPRLGVTRLSVLAKGALDAHLAHSLEQLQAQLAERRAVQQQLRAAAAAAARPLAAVRAAGRMQLSDSVSSQLNTLGCATSGCVAAAAAPGIAWQGSCLDSCAGGSCSSRCGGAGAAAASAGCAPPGQGAAPSCCSDDVTCGICFDAPSAVQLAGCRHAMCVGCVQRLLAVATSAQPAACPYCRQGVRGFSLAS